MLEQTKTEEEENDASRLCSVSEVGNLNFFTCPLNAFLGTNLKVEFLAATNKTCEIIKVVLTLSKFIGIYFIWDDEVHSDPGGNEMDIGGIIQVFQEQSTP